jgi:hypothetical protein
MTYTPIIALATRANGEYGMETFEEELRSVLRTELDQRMDVKLTDMFLGKEISLNLWQSRFSPNLPRSSHRNSPPLTNP